MQAKRGKATSIQTRINRKLDSQFGVISRKQALSAGLTRTEIETRLKKEVWQSVLPGIYKVGGSPATPDQKLMAAILWAGEGAVVSHRSAAWVWGLEGEFNNVVEIICPKIKRPPPGVIIHHRNLTSSEKTHFGVLPITTVTRTLFDLASIIPMKVLLVARDDALRRRLTTWRRLRLHLDRTVKGQSGARAFRMALIGDNLGESPLERRFLAMARRFRLPKPKLQYPVRLNSGKTIFIDFAFPQCGLAVEVDGFGFHGQALRWQQDMDRQNELTELNWRTVRFSEADLTKRPEQVAARIVACLTQERQLRLA